jgi:hypothetical protein
MHHGNLLHGTALQERVLLTDIRQSSEVGDDLLDFSRIWPPLQTALLGFTHLGGGNHLHGAGDFGNVTNASDATADFTDIRHGLLLPLFHCI